MIVRVSRSGGFAGTRELLGTLDTAGLSVEEADRLRTELGALERLTGEPVGSDLYRYQIEILDQRQPARVLTILHEGDPAIPLPEPLAAILLLLADRGR